MFFYQPVSHIVDAEKLCMNANSWKGVKLAPTKEVLSFRLYSAKCRMNRLRCLACNLFQSDKLTTVIRKVEREIELGRIMIRKDKKIHSDLGRSCDDMLLHLLNAKNQNDRL